MKSFDEKRVAAKLYFMMNHLQPVQYNLIDFIAKRKNSIKINNVINLQSVEDKQCQKMIEV